MTRVSFYVVQATGEIERLRVAVRLADKAFARGHRVYINTVNETQGRELDALLWTHRPESFLPHAICSDSEDEPIAIGWGREPRGHDDLLINLQLEIPSFFSRFHRVVEVVTQDERSLNALRRAWRFYRERGYQLEKHDL